MTTTNFLTIDFSLTGDREPFSFTSDKPLETNQELIEAAKEFSQLAHSGEKFIIGLWEDFDRLQVKKLVPVNQNSGFSEVQHEYFAALTWKQICEKYCEHILGKTPEYDPQSHETAILYEEAASKETGYDRAIAYLKETEDRLIEESHEKMKQLPQYEAQAKSIEWLFEQAKTDYGVRTKVIDLAAKTQDK